LEVSIPALPLSFLYKVVRESGSSWKETMDRQVLL